MKSINKDATKPKLQNLFKDKTIRDDIIQNKTELKQSSNNSSKLDQKQSSDKSTKQNEND